MKTVFIILMLMAAFFGFHSAVLSAESVKETRGKRQPASVLIAFTVISAIFGALAIMPWSPVLYTVALIILAGLQLINQEGSRRRQSWNWLAIAYSFLLLFTVFIHRIGKTGKFSVAYLVYLIPMLLPFIAGGIQTARLDDKTRKKATKGNAKGNYRVADSFSNIAIAVLLVSLVIVIALIMKRG